MKTASPFSDLHKIPAFYRRNSNIFPSESSIRWYLRDRKTNGLLDCGAVVELRASPESERPRLFIDENRFLDWMRGRGMLGIEVA
jgi:hypothetical protein